MTEGIQVALIAAIPATIFGAGTIIAVFRVKKENERRHDDVVVKLDHITVLTNSTLATALLRIADLEKQVEKLNAALVFFNPQSQAAAVATAAVAAAAVAAAAADPQVRAVEASNARRLAVTHQPAEK